MKTTKELLAGVAACFDVTPEQLTGPGRTKELSRARHAAMLVLRRVRTDLSLQSIAACLGREDHTTVIYGLARAEQLLRTDPEFRATMVTLIVTLDPGEYCYAVSA